MATSQPESEDASQACRRNSETQVSGVLQDYIPDGSYQRLSRKSYITITKLNAYNYWSWNKIAKLQLKTMNVWAIITGKEPQPDKVTRPRDFEAWAAHDTLGQLWIRCNIEDDQSHYLCDAASAKEMWDLLQQGQRSWAKMIHLKRKLIGYKAKPGSSVEQIAGELSGLQRSITEIKASETPSDLDLALRLMDSVQGTEYARAKFLLEEVLLEESQDLTFDHARQRLHLVDWKKRL